ncbi:unnamed protein product [Rotaria sp. Silwood2]|nr:unnamed protein product [Rotaria sp. Silwood2]
MILLVIAVFAIISVNLSVTQSSNGTSVVKLPRIADTSQLYPEYFIFYQAEHETFFPALPNVYSKVPGLTFAVYHKQPAIYELKFQALCRGQKTWAGSFRHFIIDDRILISNQLLPNNDQRQVVAPELGSNVFTVDSRGGGLSNLNKIKLEDNSSKTLNNNFQDHWNKMDIDGTGRVSKEKFMDYMSKSNDYKHYFDQKKL